MRKTVWFAALWMIFFGLAPPANPRPYDILPDGRFVAIDAAVQSGDQQIAPIQVVVNWFEEVKRKVPGR